MAHRYLFLLAALALSASGATAQITFTSVDDGDWSNPATWDQNAVPTVGSNVVIEDFDDVVLDVSAHVNDVAITENGDLYFSGTTAVTLTVRGDITLGPNSRFRPNDRPSAGPFVRHTLRLEGDLTGVGEVDFRRGSNGSGTATGVDVTFQGSGVSTVNLTGPSSAQLLDNYSPIGRANEFNSVTFAKTGDGRVVLQSSIESSNNSSTGEATCDFDGGVVEVATGQALVCASSASTTVEQSDPGSYVIGTFGRGLGNSGATTQTFYVGDGTQGRPVTIEADLTGASTPFLLVTLVNESANAPATTYLGDLEKVSQLRYYRVQYDDEGEGVTGTLTGLDITYASDDGVADGNTDLRVATSADDGSTWVERGGSDHTTDASGATIESETVSLTLADEETLLLALGNAIGGANTLSDGAPPPVPTFSAAFAPASVIVGGTSTLTFTIENTAEVAATDLDLANNLPAGLEVATPSNASTTCTGGTLTAVGGASSLSYSGGSVAAGASCTVAVDVTATSEGVLVNTSGALTSSLGDSGTASATLAVGAAPATISFSAVQRAVPESDGSFTLTLRLEGTPATPTEVVVALEGGSPSDLGGFRADTLRVGPASPSTIEVEVPITNDASREGDEAFQFVLLVEGGDSGPLVVGAIGRTVILVVDDDQDNPVVQLPIRDADGDGEEDGGLRFVALPVGGVPVSDVAAAAGGGPVYWYRSGPDATLAPPDGILTAGEPVLVDVAPGAALSLSGAIPTGDAAVLDGVEVDAGSASRVLVAVGNPTSDPVRLGAIAVTGGTLADVALVFDAEAGAFRPVSLAGLDDAVVPPFEAVVLQVTPEGDAADVAATIALDGSASGTGDAIGDVPFMARESESALVVTLAEQGAATGDELALRFDDDAEPGLDPLDGIDLISPLGLTLSARAPEIAAPFAALSQGPPTVGTSITIPLTLSVSGAGTYQISYEAVALERPVTVDLLDRGAPSRLAEGGTYTFSASAENSDALAGRFALRLTFQVGVSTEAPVAEMAVEVYPNPSPGATSVHVTGAPAGTVRVSLYDALGRLAAVLHDGPVPDGDLLARVERGRLAPGVYVLRIDGADRSEVRRFTVTR